ncbi:hypothetical protein Bbelb_065490 [Branchiostoma belcheri]|nr:hypothetical protein Bbelb_065490 [Branchiostoma belcheri]
MEENDRQQANKDNITRPNLENTTATSSANVVRTVEPQTTSMFASAERLPNQPYHYMQNCDEKVTWVRPKSGRNDEPPPRGRMGVYCYSQENVIWSDLVTKCDDCQGPFSLLLHARRWLTSPMRDRHTQPQWLQKGAGLVLEP